MDRLDGRGWSKAPKWVGRLAGRPIDWLEKKLVGKLEKLDQQEPDPAQKALDRVEGNFASMIRLFGPDGGPSARARADVATQLEKMGRLAEARLLREAVLESVRCNLGVEHLDAMAAEMWLAVNLYKQGLNDEAKPLFTHAYEGRRSQLGTDDERTMRAQRWLSHLGQWPGEE